MTTARASKQLARRRGGGSDARPAGRGLCAVPVAGGHLSPSGRRPHPDGEGNARAPDSHRPVAATCVVWPPISCELEHGETTTGSY